MIYIELGKGEIGIEAQGGGIPTITLHKLKRTQIIGTHFEDSDGEPIIRILFSNEKSLDNLIEALSVCKANMITIPDNLRLGA